MSKPDGGPAFPTGVLEDGGMSLRDYFAGQALAGMLSQPVSPQNALVHDDTHTAARWAYGFADAMIAERAKP